MANPTRTALAVLFICAAIAAPALAQTQGSIKVKATPRVAGVFIDGKYAGAASGGPYPASPGEHEVKLVDPRHEDSVNRVTVTEGKVTTLVISLKKKAIATANTGVLRVIYSDLNAAVYLNKDYMGQVKEFDGPGQGMRLAAGEYALECGTLVETVKVEAGKTTIVGRK
jgi:hypothetical protein